MGVVADAALEAGAEVIGVIPQALVDREIAHTGLSDLRIVRARCTSARRRWPSWPTRSSRCPAASARSRSSSRSRPGRSSACTRKPCGLLNVRGYYDGLAGMLDHAVAERFLRPENRAILIVESEPEAMIDALAAWEPPVGLEKWLDRDES